MFKLWQHKLVSRYLFCINVSIFSLRSHIYIISTSTTWTLRQGKQVIGLNQPADQHFTSQYHMFVGVVLMSILCIQPNCVLHFPFCLLFFFFFMAQFPFQRTISTNWRTVGSRVRPNHSKPPFLCLDHPCLFFNPLLSYFVSFMDPQL